ncbi:MAG TPA: Gfo/Idh/MocA family oxidoreductase [Gemmataceae bacterium]|nr:Gfo/Idh/MocA family oxidoreductase [Gemmataceae bacterium]
MQIRWGLLGCGDIVRKRVARAILDEPRSRLLAACRRDSGRVRDFCQAFGVERAYTCDADLLADPEIDAVYIATPVHLHFPQTLAAAAAGKHVLVEKPMARTVAECDQMIDACRAVGVKLGVAYYRRFYPIVHRMKELLASGELGRPLAISAVTSTSFALGPGDEGYWRVVPAEGGGGALMDIGSHRLNLFLDLLGEVVDVQARIDTLLGAYEAEDAATLLLHFRSGAHGTLQCFFGTTCGADDFSILGRRGRLSATPLNGEQLVIESIQGQRIETHPPPGNLHAPLIVDFVSAILEGHSPLVTGEEGRRTNNVMERAYRACKQG